MLLNSNFHHINTPSHQIVCDFSYLSSLKLLNLTQKKSYVPILGCVIDHILGDSELSNLEKLFYISADALSLINASSNKQKGVALPSYRWANQLGCSRSQVFKLQKSLSEKGYFSIIKDKNKVGQNKRNFITPTLPDKVFNVLVNSSPRAGVHLPYNHTIETNKAYLERTKLFIGINYQLLKTITSNAEINPFHKIIWLDLFTKCYKYNCGKKNEDKNLSVTVSYSELASRYSCDNGYLSKAMNILVEAGFISKRRFQIKDQSYASERQDKSLWQITLVIPSNYEEVLLKLNDRSNLKLDSYGVKSIVSTKIPDLIESSKTQQYHKGLSFQTTHKFTGPYSGTHITTITEIAPSNLENGFTNYNSQQSSCDPQLAKFRLLLNKDLKTNNKFRSNESNFYENEISESDCYEKPQITRSSSILKSKMSSEQKSACSPYVGSVNTKLPDQTTKPYQATKQEINRFKGSQLIRKPMQEYHPLTEEDAITLRKTSGRIFALGYINKLLLKIAIEKPENGFYNKDLLLSYMTKALIGEGRDAELANKPDFKFRPKEGTAEYELRLRENYLNKLESGKKTDISSIIKRKIIGLFNENDAYDIITNCVFPNNTNNHNTNNYTIVTPIYITEAQKLVLTIAAKEVLGDDIKVNFKDKIFVLGNTKCIKKDKEYAPVISSSPLWQKVRECLQIRYGDDIDKSWFSMCDIESNTDNKQILIKAPTSFVRDWIKTNYSCAIENIISELSKTAKHLFLTADINIGSKSYNWIEWGVV